VAAKSTIVIPPVDDKPGTTKEVYSAENPPPAGTFVMPPGARLATEAEAKQYFNTNETLPGIFATSKATDSTEVIIMNPLPSPAATSSTPAGTGGNSPGIWSGVSLNPNIQWAGNGLTTPLVENYPINNPLHQFASYTYAISLWKLSIPDLNGLMSATTVEEALAWNPTVISSNYTSSYVVAEDSGLYPNQRVPNTLGINYNIQSLSFDCIIAPGKLNRATNMITGEMEVVEPIGCTFLDSLIEASWDGKKYVNYTQQPYMIQIDFNGYDDNGKEISKSDMAIYRKRFPIKLLGVEIAVDKSGSKYKISFCPTGAGAFLPDKVYLKEQVTINASTVGEFFKLLTLAMDETNKRLIKKGSMKFADSFVFKLDPMIESSSIIDKAFAEFKDASPGVKGVKFDKKAVTIPPKTDLRDIITKVIVHSDYLTTAQGIGVGAKKIKSSAEIYNLFKVTSKIEYKGIDAAGTIHERVFDDARNDIPIMATINISQYPTYQTQNPAVPSAAVDPSPYTVKKYDYIYTGHNNDIENLSIKFDTTYYTAFMADTFQGAAASVGPNTANAIKISSGLYLPLITLETQAAALGISARPNPSVQRFIVDNSNQNDTTVSDNPDVRTAQNIVRTLYKGPGGDMIVVNLDIVGDPTLIKQDDWLYILDPTKSVPKVNQSDFALKWNHIQQDQAQVVVELNINTPLDVDLDVPNGLGNQGLYFPAPGVYRSLFSGRYSINMIKNTFANGKFSQSLELVRYINDSLTSRAKGTDADAVRLSAAQQANGVNNNGYNVTITNTDGSTTNPESGVTTPRAATIRK